MIRSLEGGRGLAALIVVLYHAKLAITGIALVRNGYLFVDLFFVLSGFVISSSYEGRLRSPSDIRVFLIRRIGRLAPLLLFSTALFVAVANLIVLLKRGAIAYGYGAALMHPEALQYLLPSLSEIVAILTFSHSMGVFDHLILNTPSWSISVEFYTYIVYAAVCASAIGRTRFATLLSLLIIGAVTSMWGSAVIHQCASDGGCLGVTYDFGFSRCLFSFFLGVITQRLDVIERTSRETLQILGCAALAVLFWLVDRVPALAFVMPLVFALLVFSVSRDTGVLSRLLKLPPFQLLGKYSYSIYLLHIPLLMIFEIPFKRAVHPLQSLGVLAAFLLVLLLASHYSYRLIENPFRHRFNKWAAGGKAGTTAALS